MFTNVTHAGNIKAVSREQRTRNDVNNSAITGAEWLLANNDKCGNITQGTVGIIGNSGAARCQQLMNVGENFASSQRQTTIRGGRGRRDTAQLPMTLTCLLPLTFRRRDTSYFCNQNAIWSRSETNVCRSADSFNITDCPPPPLIYISCKSDRASSLEHSQNFPYTITFSFFSCSWLISLLVFSFLHYSWSIPLSLNSVDFTFTVRGC